MRNIKKLIALVLALVMSLALMGLANAAEPSDADQAKALAESASELRLSVYELQVKAGDTYNVRILPKDVAQTNGWQIGDVVPTNQDYLAVDEVDQENLTVTLKGVKDGGTVGLKVQLENPTLDKLIEANPALASYAKAAQNALSKVMACKVVTNKTETKAVKGVDAGDPITATPATLGVTIPGVSTVTVVSVPVEATSVDAPLVRPDESDSALPGDSGTTPPPQ